MILNCYFRMCIRTFWRYVRFTFDKLISLTIVQSMNDINKLYQETIISTEEIMIFESVYFQNTLLYRTILLLGFFFNACKISISNFSENVICFIAFSLEVKIDWCKFLCYWYMYVRLSVHIALISGHINNKQFRCTWWNYKSRGLHLEYLTWNLIIPFVIY